MLRGILDFVRGHAPWAITLQTGRRGEIPVNATTFDGLFVNTVTPELRRHIRTHHTPIVLVSATARPTFPGCVLACDNAPIATEALTHLRTCCCTAYAFAGVPHMPWSALRERGFAQALARDGLECHRLATEDLTTLARELADLPKPLGIFAADDVRARLVLDGCRLAHCHVPDEVAILGVDNDETLCEMSSPTLSSIPLTTRAAGYRAAEILDQALRGAFVDKRLPHITYTSAPVMARQSTARSLTKDALVRHCHELLESRFAEKIRIVDLAKALHVSRRTLETHYRIVTGSSIQSDLLSLRLSKAKHLLVATNRSIESIALDCGFCDASHLSTTLHHHEGVTPSIFRQRQGR